MKGLKPGEAEKMIDIASFPLWGALLHSQQMISVKAVTGLSLKATRHFPQNKFILSHILLLMQIFK